jgi:methylenetetrahydrofolate--tRNA-(uracil-5-)-methyltransferase
LGLSVLDVDNSLDTLVLTGVKTSKITVHVVGGGLAGSEAAWQVARAGIPVTLHEMRPAQMTPAHQTGNLAELVCSNSLKSMDESSAPGLLKSEMAALDSLIIKAAMKARVPAGQALAVDRVVFADAVKSGLLETGLVTIAPGEVTELPTQEEAEARGEFWIVATGPLTSQSLAGALQKLTGSTRSLYFYDAIAPVLAAESVDMESAFRADRYGEGESGDYLNVPLNKEEYESFIDAVIAAEKMPLHDFEEPKYFESCLPIEVMIDRGRDTLRFGPMKPVGLKDPRTGHRPWAAIQLRQENQDGTMFSMVGFQTKMKWPEQKRVFSMIPALRNVEILRYGSIHRNTYLKSPEFLGHDLSFKSAPRIYLAGQISGVEGYTESAAIGLMAGRACVAKARDQEFTMPPRESMIGALGRYVTEGCLGPYQPMNANFGLLPPPPVVQDPARKKPKKLSKADRKSVIADRARQLFVEYQERILRASPSE